MFLKQLDAGIRCDALVVGGGPAGVAAGIALRRRGLEVVVAEALLPPIDKACGEGLMPDSRRELARLGVEVPGGREFSGIHFASQGRDHQDFVHAEFPHGTGIGIRRTQLHRGLLECAEAIGVRFLWGCRTDLRADGEVRVGGTVCSYRYLVGADGEASRTRTWAGLERSSVRSLRFGFRRHYRMTPWSNRVEVHWGRSGQAYVTPIAEDEVCVAALTRQRGVGFDRILADLPSLQEKLGDGLKVGRDRGGVTTTRKLRRVVGQSPRFRNVALVGDASGSADAITGSGLASAFRQAGLLGDALGRDAIADYQNGHRKILHLPQAMASLMLTMDRWPWWRDRVMRTFADRPEIFARMLAVHVGEAGSGSYARGQGIRLAAGLP